MLEAGPQPEPWTAARYPVNAYYDIYVKWAALILIFMVACNFVTDSHIWLHLKTGQLIAKQSAPVTTDVFSYTQSGQPWYNVPWLFQWVHAAIYDFAYSMVPVDAIDPTANRAKAEQIAVGTLVVVDALIRFLTAWLILKARPPRPRALVVSRLCDSGTWRGLPPHRRDLDGWDRGAFVRFPIDLGPVFPRSGAADPVSRVLPGQGHRVVLPHTRFSALGQRRRIILVRARRPGGLGHRLSARLGSRVDETARASRRERAPTESDIASRETCPDQKGRARAGAGRPGRVRPGLPRQSVGLACFPSGGNAVCAPFRASRKQSGWPVNELSFFSPELREQLGDDWYLLPAYFLGVVAVGLSSFLLNVRRFSWTRFLPFAVMAALWGVVMHANAAFALVFAWVLAPNGQEWYQDRFGTQGRMGARWTFWSTGGRLVTLALIFLIMSKDITGWGNTSPDIQFGLGYHPDSFTMEAADFLDRHNEIKGNILNTSMHQGDILIWKTAPKRKTYVDGRAHLFGGDLLEQWRQTRLALSEDNVAGWKPLLDKYEISAVMVEPADAPNTHKRLLQSPNWVPFYDDGRIVMFGRADAPAEDLAFFKANKLDADLIVYQTPHLIPGAERPPNPTSWIDGIFQNRTFSRPQSRTESARRWLIGDPSAPGPAGTQQGSFPDPAHCILAIQQARTALAHSPDDWIAFRMLADAYRFLMVQENGMLAGIPITADNSDRISRLEPKFELLMNRVQHASPHSITRSRRRRHPQALRTGLDWEVSTSSWGSSFSSSACVIWLVTVSKPSWTVASPAIIRATCSLRSSSSSASLTRPSRKSMRKSTTSRSSGLQARSTRRTWLSARATRGGRLLNLPRPSGTSKAPPSSSLAWSICTVTPASRTKQSICWLPVPLKTRTWARNRAQGRSARGGCTCCSVIIRRLPRSGTNGRSPGFALIEVDGSSRRQPV